MKYIVVGYGIPPVSMQYLFCLSDFKINILFLIRHLIFLENVIRAK